MSDFWFHRFRTDVVCLVLVLRLYFLRDAVELLLVPFLILFFLLVFVHLITSGIVWEREWCFIQEKSTHLSTGALYYETSFLS